MASSTIPLTESCKFEKAVESIRIIYQQDTKALTKCLQAALDSKNDLEKQVIELQKKCMEEKESVKTKICGLKEEGNAKLKKMHADFLKKQQILRLRHNKLQTRYKELVEILIQHGMSIPSSHHVNQRNCDINTNTIQPSSKVKSCLTLNKKSRVIYFENQDLYSANEPTIDYAVSTSNDYEDNVPEFTFDSMDQSVEEVSRIALKNTENNHGQAGKDNCSVKPVRPFKGIQQCLKTNGVKRERPLIDVVGDSPQIKPLVSFKKPRRLLATKEKQVEKVSSIIPKNTPDQSMEPKDCTLQSVAYDKSTSVFMSSVRQDNDKEKLHDTKQTSSTVFAPVTEEIIETENSPITDGIDLGPPSLSSTPYKAKADNFKSASVPVQMPMECSVLLSPPIACSSNTKNLSGKCKHEDVKEAGPLIKEENFKHPAGVFPKTCTGGTQPTETETLCDSFWDKGLSEKPVLEEAKCEESSTDMFNNEVEDKHSKSSNGSKHKSLKAHKQDIISNSSSNDEDTFIQSFRRRKKEKRLYKYDEVVRKREERDKLNGFACKDCQEFYKNENLTKEELQSRLKKVCRHKARFSPPPSTPSQFWDIEFPTNYIEKKYMLDENDSLPDHAKPKWRKRLGNK